MKGFTKCFKVVSLMLVIVMLVGCSSESTTKTSRKSSASSKKSSSIEVGIVLPTKDEPRWLQDKAKFEELLKEAGFSSEVAFSQGDSNTEKANVESLISKGIKVLVICPQDATKAQEAVDKAKEKGITVISYDRLITQTESVDYYVTFDSAAVGKAQGQFLVDSFSGKKDVPLYLYAGATSDNNAFIFFAGAWSVLQPKIADGTFVIQNSAQAKALSENAELTKEQQTQILTEITTDWDATKASEVAKTNLSDSAAKKGDVAILAPNDGTARAIGDTFVADSAINSYVITGQDAEKDSVQYILDGKQNMTVFKNTGTLASDTVAMCIDILNGKTAITDTNYNNEKKDVPSKQTAIEIVKKDTVKSILIDSGYYEASAFTGLN